MTERNSGANETGRLAAAELADELRQPLAAACNYIAVARLQIGSNVPDSQRAIASLEKAESEILRAGEIASRIRLAMATKQTRH